jgi:hypothetical protein
MSGMVGQAHGAAEAGSVSPVGHVRTKCSACCTACGSHFTGVSAFDAHRCGPASGRYCDTDRPALVAKTEHGSCSIGRDVPLVGVTVWALAGWDKARERAA